MAQNDKIRLMTRVARMYYSQAIRQTEITERLNIHQSTVSRLLKKAYESGIIRISVTVPSGIHADLEESLESRFGLKEAVVVDSVTNDEGQIVRDLGGAGAYFMELAVKPGEVIGISSWSASLLEMINAMHPTKTGSANKVVQILGGLGNPAAQMHATHLTQRLAYLIEGTAVLLPVPGITTSIEARKVLLKESYVQTAMDLFDRMDMVLVGIGAVEPSRLLASSGNVFGAGVESTAQTGRGGRYLPAILRLRRNAGAHRTRRTRDWNIAAADQEGEARDRSRRRKAKSRRDPGGAERAVDRRADHGQVDCQSYFGNLSRMKTGRKDNHEVRMCIFMP